MPDMAPDILAVPEVARLLRVNRNTDYDLVRSGSLYGARIGHVLRVPRSEVERFLGLDRGARSGRSRSKVGSGRAGFMSERDARSPGRPTSECMPRTFAGCGHEDSSVRGSPGARIRTVVAGA